MELQQENCLAFSKGPSFDYLITTNEHTASQADDAFYYCRSSVQHITNYTETAHRPRPTCHGRACRQEQTQPARQYAARINAESPEQAKNVTAFPDQWFKANHFNHGSSITRQAPKTRVG
jgi:hypothetical protein